jgi:hypothetical protein
MNRNIYLQILPHAVLEKIAFYAFTQPNFSIFDLPANQILTSQKFF